VTASRDVSSVAERQALATSVEVQPVLATASDGACRSTDKETTGCSDC